MILEVMTHLAPTPGRIYGDLTFGDGGYTKAILGNLKKKKNDSKRTSRVRYASLFCVARLIGVSNDLLYFFILCS
jgi:16S rRNA C1402 N4-methylase RsmH